MGKAEERALEAYPPIIYDRDNNKIIGGKYDNHTREIFIKGYKQAEQDTIERACQLLYDWNKQMTVIFGSKAVLSCNQFTIDVDRFRKILKME